MNTPSLLPFVSLTWIVAAGAQQAPTLIVHGDQPGKALPASLHGINLTAADLADGGPLRSEMLRNRSFEEPPGSDGTPPGWTLELDTGAAASLTRDAERPFDAAAPHALRLRIERGAAAVVTAGHAGVPLREGAAYALRLGVRRDDALPASLVAMLTGRDGEVLSELEIRGLRTDWQRYELRLESPVTAAEARFAITCRGPGTLWLDAMSLCPLDTFQLRPEGLRRDLVEMLQALRPGFVRFPLPPERSDLHAFLQLCEDLRAEPVLVAAGSLDDTLAAIAYANGDGGTQQGAARVQAGHPEPFGLRLVERHEPLPPTALVQHPGLVAIVRAGTTPPAGLVAEQVERPVDWLWAEMDRYGAVDRGGAQVVVDVTPKDDAGSLGAALARAAFLCGLERAGDRVAMVAGAPLLSWIGERVSAPGAILCAGGRTAGTPDYWQQVLFARHRADTRVPVTLDGLAPRARFTAVGGLVDSTGEVVVKVVNGGNEPRRVRLDLSACGKLAARGEGTVLTGGSLDDTNTLAAPTNVALRTFEVAGVDRVFEFEFAARSLTGLRLQRAR